MSIKLGEGASSTDTVILIAISCDMDLSVNTTSVDHQTTNVNHQSQHCFMVPPMVQNAPNHYSTIS